ncbi:alpha/beta-hydrolase [Hymenopellis radicata]|nr:alpha/beta-hydrolase [Hymenopellis radicata]
MPLLTSADGTLLFADAVGDPSKPALVFIHGLCVGGLVWDAIFEDPKWSEVFYLVRYDTRGHGQSGMPTDPAAWESQRLAEDFDAVVDAFALSALTSMGATHAADILALHPPSYLSGIIHLEAVPFATLEALGAICKDAPKSLFPLIAAPPDVSTFQHACNQFVGICSNVASFKLKAICLGYMIAQPRAVVQIVLGRTQDPTGLLKAGEEGLPLLAMGAANDLTMYPEVSFGFMERFKNKKLVIIEGADHMPWLTQSEFMRQTILSWIQNVREKSV